MNAHDTIVAVSSAVGPAVRMIVRVSGSRAIELFNEIRRGKGALAPGAYRVSIQPPAMPGALGGVSLDDASAVPCWVYLFGAPRSYTGDDLVELHLPGNPLLARGVVDDLVKRGARHAEAGEFTARAYLNGRLDLSAAEGVAMTIAAGNEAELRAARQLLSGELSRRLSPLMEKLAETLALLEAGIDFTEEDISFISPAELSRRIDEIEHDVRSLLKETSRFERLSHEPRFALIGKPNAGKSTLLNALAGHERAVVSPVAGTTRDALSARVALDQGVATVIDVAGLESVGDDPHGVRAQMQDRAARAAAEADFVLQVIDASDDSPTPLFLRRPDLTVLNKADLPIAPEHSENVAAIRVSARFGDGLSPLRRAMSDLAFGSSERASLTLNARHLRAIDECLSALALARGMLNSGAIELIALDLREALDALGRILGRVTPDDVLGRIFGSFCVGK